MNPVQNLPLSDRALQPGEKDLLGRGAFVRNLAKILCNAPKGDSVVFALYGKWGEGKTSTLTLLDAEFEALKGNGEAVPTVIRFNPWVFSGRERLFAAFFEDIGNAIGASGVSGAEEKAKKWKRLGAYSNLLGQGLNHVDTVLNVFGASVPGWKLLGQFLGSVGDVAEQAAAAEDAAPDQNLAKIREELEVVLHAVPQPLLVILDDLDRLPPAELVEIFQLLKSTVDLPNVHYLLLCDRGNIERNLEKQELRADYLEKIVQFSAPLPAIPDAVLRELLITQLQAIFKEFSGNDGRFDDELWARIRTSSFPEVFATLRDVKRFVGEVRMSLPVFCRGGHFELNPEHFLKLQALRLFCPSVVELIRKRRALFMKRALGFLHLGDEDGEIAKEKKAFLEQEIPAFLNEQKASQHLPLVRDLLAGFDEGNDSVVAARAELRWLTSRLWFDAYFTLELPVESVSIADVNEIRYRLGGHQEALSQLINQVIQRSGVVALVRCLEFQFREDVRDQGQALICAILSATPGDHTSSMGSDGHWFPFHDYFARWLRLTPEAARTTKLLDLLRVSRNHIYFSALLYDTKHANDQTDDYLQCLKPLMEFLGKATAEIIEEKSAEGTQLLQDGFWYAHDTWVEWGSKSYLQSWIRKVSETDEGLKEYLGALGGYKDLHDGSGEQKEYFCLNHHRLSVFPDLREGMRRCSRLLTASENAREALLWESALTAFKDQLVYRRGFRFFNKHHPGFLKARFHPITPFQLPHDNMAVITAENPRGEIQTPEENQRLTRLLAAKLKSRRIPAIPIAVGAADGSHLEQSFLISSNLIKAVEIGKEHEQVAVFMIYDGRFVDVVACRGEGKHRLGLLSQLVVWPPLASSKPQNITE
jgi:hypothetical protein